MTIVVHWINNENINFPNLWVVTDSLLSNSSKYTREIKPLFQCGAKLFSIRIICLQPDNNGFLNNIYFSTTVGMSFAGSSLLALNLYAFLSFSLTNLMGNGIDTPSLKGIAQHAYTVFQSLLNDYIEVNFDSPPCEISIFGFCPVTHGYELYHIVHRGVDKNSTFKRIDWHSENFHLMGDHKEDIKQHINEYQLNNNVNARAPKIVVEDLIKKETYKTIGGRRQLGICNSMGFHLMAICKSIIHGQPQATFFYQNIDIYSQEQLNRIDNLLVGVKAMI